MQLDGLIRFLEPTLKERVVDGDSGSLFPHEKLAVALYDFIESAAKSQWRATSIGELYNLTKAEQALVIDELKRIHAEGFLGIRKWSDARGRFISYTDVPGRDAEFFYRDGFELRVLPPGRPWFEQLERRVMTEVASESTETRISSAIIRNEALFMHSE